MRRSRNQRGRSLRRREHLQGPPLKPADLRAWRWSALVRCVKGVKYYAWYPVAEAPLGWSDESGAASERIPGMSFWEVIRCRGRQPKPAIAGTRPGRERLPGWSEAISSV